MRVRKNFWLTVSLVSLFIICHSSATAKEKGNLIEPGRQAWHRWSPRAAITPYQELREINGGIQLLIKANRFSQYGEWYTLVPTVHAGKYYQFDALYKPGSLHNEMLSVATILTWCGKDCLQGALQRDYIESIAQTSGLRQSSRTLKAPPGTEAVKIELVLRWTATGSIVWKDFVLREVEEPKPRVIRVATTHLTPPIPSSPELNLRLIETMLDKAGAIKADLVCLSENVVSRGIDMPVVQRTRSLAAPAMALLARKASQYGMYIATTLEEGDDNAVYNTALLYDRTGQIRLKYRKSHLPLNEAEMGYTPGSQYPVADTDFGRVGMLICWDYWFPEPARILRLKGAELLLLPLAGDSGVHWDAVTRTRALENGVYLIASGLVPASSSRIVNPKGEVLAEISGQFELAFRDIDLNQQFRDPWLSVGPGLGEGRSLYIKERRGDTYAPLTR